VVFPGGKKALSTPQHDYESLIKHKKLKLDLTSNGAAREEDEVDAASRRGSSSSSTSVLAVASEDRL